MRSPFDADWTGDRDERCGPNPTRPSNAPVACVPPDYDPRCADCGAEVDVFERFCRPCLTVPLMTGTEGV